MNLEKNFFPLIFNVFSHQPLPENELHEEKKHQYYPFDKARKGHNKAIDDLLSDSRFSCITSPTGTGKTAVYLTALAESGYSSMVVVPRNSLQEQIASYDLGDVEIVPLFAKEKHCNRKVMTSEKKKVPLCKFKVKMGDRYFVLYKDELIPFPPCSNCPYHNQIKRIEEGLRDGSIIPVVNQGNFWMFREHVDCVVIDEADESLRGIKDAISEKGIYQDSPEAILELIESNKIEELRHLENLLNTEFNTLSETEVLAINKKIEKVRNILTKIQIFKSAFIDRLLVYTNKNRNRTFIEVFEPDLFVTADRLFSDAKKIILVTATPPPYMNYSKVKVVDFTLPFPRNAIFYVPFETLTVKNLERVGRELIERVVVEFIIPTYKFVSKLTNSYKVPIHVGNLSKHGALVSEILRDNGFKVLVMEEGRQAEAINEFKKKDYNFLCVVSAEYGNDWVEYPLQIILKIPYINLYDPRVQAIKRLLGDEKFDEWYSWDAMSRIIQACGRNARDPNRFAIAVIPDKRFSVEYQQFESRIPEWFKRRLVWVPS